MDNQNSNQAQKMPIHHGSQVLAPFKRQSITHESLANTKTKTTTEQITYSYLRHFHNRYQSSVSSASDAAVWLRLLLESTVGHSQREPMLLGLSEDQTTAQGLKKRLPGIRYYSQGTEETSRPKHSIHPSSRSISRSASTKTTSTTAEDTNAATTNANTNNNSLSDNSNCQDSSSQCTASARSSVTPATPIAPAQSNINPTSSVTTSARGKDDSEENSSSTSSSSSSSSQSSSTLPTSSASGRSDSTKSSSPTAFVGARSSTSALLFSTSQEFGQIWSQTTAFLHRTFSPTYRVGSLYLESWTNGTQTRGLERLRASLLRGDALVLVRSMTVQLKDLWKRSVAEAAEIERNTRAIEEKTKKNNHEDDQKTGSNSSSSTSGGDHGNGSSSSSGVNSNGNESSRK